MKYMPVGMRRAWMGRFSVQGARGACPSCSMVVPRYPGRYPKQCPLCATPPAAQIGPVTEAVALVRRGIAQPGVAAARMLFKSEGGMRVLDSTDIWPRRPFDEPPFPPRWIRMR